MVILPGPAEWIRRAFGFWKEYRMSDPVNPAPRDTPALDDPAKYDPQPGDIGFATIPGTGGSIPLWGQTAIGDACRYDHTFWVVRAVDDPEYPDGLIIEALMKGHRYAPLRPRLRNGYAYATVDLTPEQRARVPEVAERFASARGGKGIGYSLLTYLVLALIHRGVKAPHLQRYISRRGPNGQLQQMICSHTIDEGLRQLGVQLFTDGRWSGDVTPGDIYYQTDPRVIPPIPPE